MPLGNGSTPARDLAGYLVRYPQELTFGDEEPAAVFDRYHAPDFVLRNDGLPLDREKLLAHVRPVRKNTASVQVDVQQAMISGDQVGAIYTLTAVLRKGDVVATEIYLFGRLAADGRLRRLDQITRSLPTGRA